jgi:hypothetical protein
MAKPKPWRPTAAEQALLVDLVPARMPRAAIAKRLGVSELKLRRFEKRLVFARQSMPPLVPRRTPNWIVMIGVSVSNCRPLLNYHGVNELPFKKI